MKLGKYSICGHATFLYVYLTSLSDLPILFVQSDSRVLKIRISISKRQLKYWCMEILHCLPKNRLDTKMLRVHLFSFFTIKTLRGLLIL